MSDKLNTERVERVLMACLHDEDDDTTNGVLVEGIVGTFGFRKDRLEAHRGAIMEMLSELPDEFRNVGSGGGGGWSFLNACDDRHGEQWTSFHRSMDQLFCLGKAIGAVDEVLPREMWEVLPGRMPYYRVNLPVPA